MTSADTPVPAPPPPAPGPAPADGSARQLALGVALPVVALTAVGVVGGALWAWWADPPAGTEVTRTNTELLLGRQFAVDGSYALVGLVLGLVAGVALTVPLRRTGWLLVLGVGLGGVAASAVSYGTGVFWGPGPVDDVGRDETLSGGLAVHVPGVFLTWPVGALVGLLLVVWMTDRNGDDRAGPADPDRFKGPSR